MKKESAGILLYRVEDDILQFFLVHLGGPFWVKKDLNSWTIPKGELEEGEDLYAAALREFEEETGLRLSGEAFALTPVKQKSGKKVHAFAMEGDADPQQIKSNLFSVEWPPASGRMKEFPEVHKADWFDYDTARRKINSAQVNFLDEVKGRLESGVRN